MQVHPKYPEQVRLIYWFRDYAWIVVFEPERERFANFWPSRKHTREIENGKKKTE